MPGARILVVEDENIVAKDIELRLKKMGHFVPATVPSAEEAVKVAGEVRPDLVLMDIMLRGDEPGTQAAGEIRARFDIPVIYLTAYADRDTLDRARITEPYGYILKPFDERELETAIEMALYKHRMEQELRAQRQWLATTLKSIGDAVITTDRDLRVTFVNAIAERLTGWSNDEAISHGLSEVLEIVDEETREPVENPARKALAEGAPVGLSNHTVLITRNGGEIPIDDSAAPIRDDDGTITGAVLVFRDITERKDAEAEQGRLREQLFRSQKLEAVGHLTTGVAHNFNNALNVIIGNIELALASPSDRAIECLERARTASQTASEIVDGLLTFTRRTEMVKRTIDAWALVSDVAQMCRQSFDREIEIRLDGSECAHWVSGDTSQLEQAILNLCLNAKDALQGIAPEGRQPCLSLTVGEAVAKSPFGDGEERLPHVRISVADNGIGMDEEMQGRLFEPFYTTKAPDEHAGMGLATAFAIVQEHAGWIECESKPDEGTSFHILLPAAEQDHAG